MRTLVIALALFAASAQARVESLDAIVAVVNDQAISESAVREVMRDGNPNGGDISAAVALDRLIDRTLLLAEAKKAGITVDEDAVNAQLLTIAQRNGLTSLDAFYSAVEAQQPGMYATVRRQVSENLLIEQLRRRIFLPTIEVTEQEILLELQRAVPQQGRARIGQITLPINDDMSSETVALLETQAERLYEVINSGLQTFSDAASIYGDGSEPRWVDVAALPATVADAVNTLPPDTVSTPIRTSDGITLVIVYEREVAEAATQTITFTKAQHILLTTNANNTDAQYQRIVALREQLLDGASFAELAREYSDDSGSSSNGGDLGWLEPGQTVPPFDAALQQLPIGKVSEPVQTRFGWHLIVVNERRTVANTQRARAQAINAIRQRKAQDAWGLWLENLRRNAYIKKSTHSVQ